MMLIRWFRILTKQTFITYHFISKIPIGESIRMKKGIHGKKTKQTPTEIEFMFYCKSHKKTNWHSHDHKNTALVIAGSVELQIMDRSGFIYSKPVYEGEQIVVYPFQFHRWVSISASTKIYSINHRP